MPTWVTLQAYSQSFSRCSSFHQVPNSLRRTSFSPLSLNTSTQAVMESLCGIHSATAAVDYLHTEPPLPLPERRLQEKTEIPSRALHRRAEDTLRCATTGARTRFTYELVAQIETDLGSSSGYRQHGANCRRFHPSLCRSRRGGVAESSMRTLPLVN